VPTLIYYVSGHGFGHARRTAEVLRELAALRPDVRLVVRTVAPADIFRDTPAVTVSKPPHPIEPKIVEQDTLTIDRQASLAKLAEFLTTLDATADAEAAFIRSTGATLVAADVPFLAGPAAARATVPCVGVTNFTWDWIYRHFANHAGASLPGSRDLPDRVAAAYAHMECLLQLPLGHEVTSFRTVIPMPLVGGAPHCDRAEVLARLDLTHDPRPRVLVAMRGGVSDDALRAAASGSPDLLFLAGQQIDRAPGNLRPTDPGLPFTDVLAACDLAISKAGYGILSDCITNRVALAFPCRRGFPEDDITLTLCPRYLRMAEMTRPEFEAGHWHLAIHDALAQPAPPGQMDTTGAPRVAQWLAARL